MFYSVVLSKFYRLLSTTQEVIEYADIDPEKKYGQHCKNDLKLIWQKLRVNNIDEVNRQEMEGEIEKIHLLVKLLYARIAFLERVFGGQKYVIYKDRYGVLCLWSTSQTIEDLTDFLINIDLLD